MGNKSLGRYIAEQIKDDAGFGEALQDARIEAAFEIGLAELREQRGWTQRELAERSGIQQPMIARLEKGQAPTLPTLVRLVRALDAVLTVTAEGLSLRPRGEHASEEPADHGATHNTERKPVSERQYSNPEREAEAVREPDAGYGAVAQGEAS